MTDTIYTILLRLGTEPVTDITTVAGPFMNHLEAVISDIFDPDIDFTPTDDRSRCRSCPYAALCGI